MWHGWMIRGAVAAAITLTALAVIGAGQLYTGESRAAVAQAGAASRACGVIVYEGGVAGTIRSAGERCRHVFTGAAGDIVSIWVEPGSASALAPVVQLVGPTGDIIQESGSTVRGQPAAIRYLRLPQSGVYSIIVTGYQDRFAGGYTLSLWRTNACGGSLDEFDPRYSELTSRQTECAYTFTGRQGGIFTFWVSAPDGGRLPSLLVQDASGRTIQGPTTAGEITGELPRAGIYTVIVSTGGSSQRHGRFVLSKVVMVVHLAPGCGKTVKYGEILNDTIEDGSWFDTCYYSFRAEAGDVVTIVMIRRNSSLDPYLDLRNPAGERVAWDNDSAGNKNAAIRARVLAASGLHTIRAQSYQGQTTGPFELRLGLGQFVLADQVQNVHPQRDTVNVRRSAGWRNKPASDVVGEIAAGATVEVVGGPASKDGLTWWMISYTTPAGAQITGWSAATSANGLPLLALAP